MFVLFDKASSAGRVTVFAVRVYVIVMAGEIVVKDPVQPVVL